MTSRIGWSPIGIRGLGKTTVYGLSRVPLPPARITARLDIVDPGFVEREIRRIGEPLDRLAQAALESIPPRVRRFPSEDPGRLSVLRKKSFDLRTRRPGPGFVAGELDVASHQTGDEFRRLADRDLEAAAKVDDFAASRVGFQCCLKRGHCVVDVAEIPRWGQRPESALLCAARDLRDHGRN